LSGVRNFRCRAGCPAGMRRRRRRAGICPSLLKGYGDAKPWPSGTLSMGIYAVRSGHRYNPGLGTRPLQSPGTRRFPRFCGRTRSGVTHRPCPGCRMPESQHALQDTAASIRPCIQKVANGPAREHRVYACPPGMWHPDRGADPKAGTAIVRRVRDHGSAHNRIISPEQYE
jgi:hypothetical protein